MNRYDFLGGDAFDSAGRAAVTMSVTPFGQINHATKKVFAAIDPLAKLARQRIFLNIQPFLDVLAVICLWIGTSDRCPPVGIQQ